MRMNRSNKVLNVLLDDKKGLEVLRKALNNGVENTNIVIDSIENGAICYIVRYIIGGKFYKCKYIYKNNFEKGVNKLLLAFDKYKYVRTRIDLSTLSYRLIRTLEWLVDDLYYNGGATIDFQFYTLENHAFIYQAIKLFEKMELLVITYSNMPKVQVKFLYTRQDILFNIYDELNKNRLEI